MVRGLRRSGKTIIIGLQGGQGTGKTTLATYLAAGLSGQGCRVVSFSIDDFYASYEDRKRLSAQYPGNPFYEIPRGMPGTHRTSELLSALSCLKSGNDVDLPVFDKSMHQGNGDIANRVVSVRGRQDFVLFEGWCIGTPQATSDELIEIMHKNRLSDFGPMPAAEHLEAVLSHLGPYQRLWELIDFLVMLIPDSLDLHERWRLEQEKELIARTGEGMTDLQVSSMVRHFLPLTCLCNAKIVSDVLIRINKEHAFYGMTSPKSQRG